MLVRFSVLALVTDAMQVIDIRFRQTAAGKGTAAETYLMVSEKIDAAAEARLIFLRGGNCSHVIDHYRKIVSANVERLSR